MGGLGRRHEWAAKEDDLGRKPGCSVWVMLGPYGDRMIHKPPNPEHDVIIRRGFAHATPHKDGFSD